jgi:tetratricopeptide (TPR) repeat protein
MLEKTPTDAFLLYAAALECKKAGELAKAIDFLNQTIVADGSYCYAYYQKGQCNEQAGDIQAAIEAYRAGIVAARRTGDTKALGELEQALMIIE